MLGRSKPTCHLEFDRDGTLSKNANANGLDRVQGSTAGQPGLSSDKKTYDITQTMGMKRDTSH